MRGKGIAGGVIAAAGVILIVLGIYRVITSEFIRGNVPTIVSDGFAYVLYGAVVFIAGVVIVNFRNWIALALHLAAVVPYYYAIQRVIEVGQAQSIEVLAYWSPSSIAWIVGIALNFLGIIMNRVKVGATKEERARVAAKAAPKPQAQQR